MKKIIKNISDSEYKAIYLGAAVFVVLSVAILIAWPFFLPIHMVGKDLPYEYTIHGTYIELNRYTGDEEYVEIPETIWFRPVRVLGCYRKDFGEYGAFERNEGIRKVFMPDSIQEIGGSCFSECCNLEEVQFSEELRSIEYSAFWGCTSLKSVEFPESLEVIGGSAFAFCENLEDVQLPDTLRIIKSDTFRNCKKLMDVKIPKGVEEIEGDSFKGSGWEESFQEDFVVAGKNVMIYYGGNEKEVKVPEGVEYIGSYVFMFEEEMESLELPASLKKCGIHMVFEGCENLKYVTVRNPSTEFEWGTSLEVFSGHSPKLTLIGEKGSTAEAYAEKWGHGFMEIEPEE